MQPAAVLDYLQLEAIGLALALGLLVGVQRGWVQREAAAGSRFAGIRTFGLLGLAGGIAGALQSNADALSAIILATGGLLIVLGYWRATAREPSISGTASIAGLLTLASGFMAGRGEFALASAASGIMVLVLSLRTRLHGWLQTLDEEEVIAIARFALIALVILPLLPNDPFGPLDAWRPRQLWLVVVLVSGFSFLGYFAAQHLGASRGILATAAAGSMVSSTAVTAALAGKLRDNAGDMAVLNGGIALASATMFLRVTLLCAALAPFALPTFAKLAIPGMVVSLVATALILRHRNHGAATTTEGIALRNPFALGPALVLMVLTMVLTLAARWVLERYGDAGLATVLAISGTVDVDSAIITMGNLPAGTLSAKVAGLVLLPPVLLNTLFKTGTAVALAGWKKTWPGAATLLASTAACGAALLVVL